MQLIYYIAPMINVALNKTALLLFKFEFQGYNF